MISVLFLGLLIGVQHAFEADHVAAVSSLAVGKTSVRRIVTQGAFWGAGHTITLFLASGLVLALGAALDERTAAYLEFTVGVMLVGLGTHILWRMVRDRIHFHVHSHNKNADKSGAVHFHAHSHQGAKTSHDMDSHDHDHPVGLPFRSIFVGMMHGMAGSAAVIVLSSSTFEEPWQALIYVALFGVGSIAGMALFSAFVAIPIAYAAKSLTWFNRALQSAVAFGTIALGIYVMADLQSAHDLF